MLVELAYKFDKYNKNCKGWFWVRVLTGLCSLKANSLPWEIVHTC